MAQPLSQYEPALKWAQPILGTAVAGAVTVGGGYGIVTTEALVTAPASSYTLTVTNPSVNINSLFVVNIANGTNLTGVPVVAKVVPAMGSFTIEVVNAGAAAFAGTLEITFYVLK